MSARSLPITETRPLPSRSALGELVRDRPRGLVVPIINLSGGLAALLVANAYNAARADEPTAAVLFWAGLIALFLPLAACLVHPTPTRNERLWAVVWLGIGTYAVKVLYSPTLFTFPDELQHWRTLSDIVRTGRLFEFNPILQVSAVYPGLEIATQALVSAAGLPMFGAAVLVIGVARLVLVVALFLFYEALSGSAYVAGAAVLVYVANPNFLYFGGQYGYESLALALAALTLHVLARQRTAANRRTVVSLLTATLLGIGAVVVTHHFTQFVLAALLAGWALIACLYGVLRRSRWDLIEAARVGSVAVFGAAAAAAWLELVAPVVVGYLGPNFGLGFVELAGMLSGQSSGRVPFQDGAGRHAALAEQLVGYASVLLVLLALPAGLRILWRHHRRDGAAWALAGLAIAYPLTLPLRLTPGGVATAGRLPEFLYLGLALTAGLVLVRLHQSRAPRAFTHVLATTCAVIVLLGSVFVGWGPAGRLPGDYLVSADARSVEPQGVAAAEWARRVLGFSRGLAADRTNGLLMGSHGLQGVVTVSNAREDVSPVFFAPSLGGYEQYILGATGVRFAVVDWRLAQGLPVSGVYYEFQELNSFRHTRPMDLGALGKFDRNADVNRVFDSGDITIYDVGLVSHAP